MKKDALGIWLVISIFSLPSARALDINIEDSFGMVGRIIYDLLTKEYVVFGIVIIVLVILFRSIFLAGLHKLPQFGESGVSKTIATTLSLLCTLGIAYTKINSGRNVHGFLEDILGPAGIYAAVFVTVMGYVWLRASMGKWALTGTGLVAYAVGSMINNQLMMSIGIIIFFISFIKAFGSSGKKYENYNGTNPNSGDGFSIGKFFKKKPEEEVKQKDTVALLKRQIEDDEMGLQVMRDLDAVDTKTIQLRKIETKLDDNLKSLLDEEQLIIKKDEEINLWLLRIRKNIQWYEMHSDPNNQEFIQKKNALKGRIVEYQQIHNNLAQKYDQLLQSEDQLLNQDQKAEAAEDKAEEREVDDERKLISTTTEMQNQANELIDDTTGQMQDREKVELNLLDKMKYLDEKEEELIRKKQAITEKNIELIEKIKKANKFLETASSKRGSEKLAIHNQKNFWTQDLIDNDRKKQAIGYDILANKQKQMEYLKKIEAAEKQDLQYEKKISK